MNPRKHAYNKHGDTERKTVKTTTGNTRWRPEISKPGPWNPSPEARPKSRTVLYTNSASIGTESHQQHLTKEKDKPIQPIHPSRRSRGPFNHQQQRMHACETQQTTSNEGFGNIPSSSTSTIMQDELLEEESMDITIPTIYGVYHTPKN